MLDVAILIPCYNSEAYLKALFRGIRSQTIPFTEIICYDDCSIDNTAQLANVLGAKVILGESNKGAAYARNKLIEATTCEWVHFHDADDLIDPQFNERMQEILKDKIDKIDALMCNALVQDRNTGRSMGSIEYQPLNDPKVNTIDYFLNTIGFPIMGIYKKSAIDNINGFNEYLRGNEDPDFHIRLAFAGVKFANLNEYLVTKLESENSFSHQNWDRCMADKGVCYNHYIDLLEEEYFPSIAKHLTQVFSYFAQRRNLEQTLLLWKSLRRMKLKELNFSAKANRFSRFVGVYPALVFLAILQALKRR